MANVGHNGQLRSIVERIERLEDEKSTIGQDIKDVYAEAKGNGFDVKALRAIIRRMPPAPTRRATTSRGSRGKPHAERIE